MDGKVYKFRIKCVSEKTGDWVGSGCDLEDNEWNNGKINQSILDNLFDSMGESFWELLGEFEGSVQQAIDKGEIYDTEYESLFKVFGHFHFCCVIDGEDVNCEIDTDPDEYMYPQLEYVEVDLPEQ